MKLPEKVSITTPALISMIYGVVEIATKEHNGVLYGSFDDKNNSLLVLTAYPQMVKRRSPTSVDVSSRISENRFENLARALDVNGNLSPRLIGEYHTHLTGSYNPILNNINPDVLSRTDLRTISRGMKRNKMENWLEIVIKSHRERLKNPSEPSFSVSHPENNPRVELTLPGSLCEKYSFVILPFFLSQKEIVEGSDLYGNLYINHLSVDIVQ